MRIAIILAVAGLAGCGGFGRVNQGQVVEYQRDQGLITLVADSNYRDPAHPRFDVMPAITIRTPQDPREMGPEPDAGKLLGFEAASGRLLVFDSATRSLRTVPYTVVSEQNGVSPADARVARSRFPVVDRSRGTITVYVARRRTLIEFSVPEEFRMLPDETWKIGDEIRYYYKDPGLALRLMNVSRTDLNKAGE
jgi:hypothetical protein